MIAFAFVLLIIVVVGFVYTLNSKGSIGATIAKAVLLGVLLFGVILLIGFSICSHT